MKYLVFFLVTLVAACSPAAVVVNDINSIRVDDGKAQTLAATFREFPAREAEIVAALKVFIRSQNDLAKVSVQRPTADAELLAAKAAVAQERAAITAAAAKAKALVDNPDAKAVDLKAALQELATSEKDKRRASLEAQRAKLDEQISALDAP